MRLVFDIGNSSIKGGIYVGTRLESTFRTTHEPAAISAAIDSEVRGRSAEWAGIASVVPDSTRILETILQGRDIPSVTVRHDMKLPFRLDYKTPETLGSDRLAAAAAAWLRYGEKEARSVVALDAGTAFTYEVVDREGVYRGGTIAAGPALIQRALSRETAQLPEVPLEIPNSIIGRSTVEALQAGIMYGFIENVRGLLRRISRDIGGDQFVVATGGWSTLLHDHVDEIAAVEPHLVLDGIRLLVEMNR